MAPPDKKHPKLIIISGPSAIESSAFKLLSEMKDRGDICQTVSIDLGEIIDRNSLAAFGHCGVSMREASKAFEELGKVMSNMDFSDLEQRIIIDSITPDFASSCYDEYCEIPKKAFKRLAEQLPDENSGRKPVFKAHQTNKWRNKWNKKIKKKL